MFVNSSGGSTPGREVREIGVTGSVSQVLGTGEYLEKGGGTFLDGKKELGEKADLAPADRGKEPAGYARVWPEHL